MTAALNELDSDFIYSSRKLKEWNKLHPGVDPVNYALYQKIKKRSLSFELFRVLSRMLTRDANERPSPAALLQDRYWNDIKGNVDSDDSDEE